jgi:EAL and modified HD-GYP domain-containing signal transduction protein
MFGRKSDGAKENASVEELDGSLDYDDADAMLCRDEITDSRNRLCGYRFTFQPAKAGGHAPEEAFFEVLEATDVPAFAARRMALIPVSGEAIAEGRHVPLIAPYTVFLADSLQTSMPADTLAGHLAALRKSGPKVALKVSGKQLAPQALLSQADFYFVNLHEGSVDDFQVLLGKLKTANANAKFAVDGVETWDEQRMCLSLGAEFCLGGFMSKADDIDPEGRLDQGRLTSIQLLNLLRSDADVSELSEVAKRDPGLTFQLLKWANAPGIGSTTAVTSLNQAIIVLGRNHLYRWLTVSMFRLGTEKERDESLLEIALTRARFLETAGPKSMAKAQRDELFLVGMLSLFEQLLKMPMAKILDVMHLAADIREVLLNGEGPYGPYLKMVLLLERNQVEKGLALADQLGIEADSLADAGSAAFAWAQEALRASQ